MKQFDQLMEMDISDIISSITKSAPNVEPTGGCPAKQPVIQPDSNIGEFGQNQASVESFQIMKTEDGCIKINTNVMCCKLQPGLVNALKMFLNEAENVDSEEGDINNG